MNDRPTGGGGESIQLSGKADWTVELPVLGVPVAFEVAHPALIEPVERTFGIWRTLSDRPGLRQNRDVRIQLFFDEDHAGDRDRAKVRYHLPRPDLLLVRTPGSTGVADRLRDKGVLYATPSLVSETDHFSYSVLSALTLFLVTSQDRIPVHAAALVGPSGRGLLLHGPSGAGKSTLCVAAHRAGYRVLAEDVVYVQVEPDAQVWGAPGPAHVPPGSLDFFPGLVATGRRIRAGGREKVVVPLRGPQENIEPMVRAPVVVLLEPSTGAPQFTEASSEDIAEAVGSPREPGFDLTRGAMDPVVNLLAAEGAWRLRVGSDPDAAVQALKPLLDEPTC
jgi:hypothetical protein